ncbi:MAG: hypothetical protein RIC95_05905 [Vicingaceae bacterium]
MSTTNSNYNFEIVSLEQGTPIIYNISLSIYTNIGYQLYFQNDDYTPLGTVTYKGKNYVGMELLVEADPKAETPKKEEMGFFVPNEDPSTIGIYVKCGDQVETVNYP